ncbi:hypothetical protein NLI96_g2688 [Meripilus lineatus]|uniref:Uncharacterized protein n=1 Tax=Meripilus lineatus TaxID=2056292 RepID=A0AAD5V864_9APHY|nr:hypothetical protein NLI96_g2688 [Physisporinus lineatus]
MIGNIGAPLNHGALSISTNPGDHKDEYEDRAGSSDTVVYISENPLAAGLAQDGVTQDDSTLTDQTSDALIFWEAI